jgi:hypothetical protein
MMVPRMLRLHYRMAVLGSIPKTHTRPFYASSTKETERAHIPYIGLQLHANRAHNIAFLFELLQHLARHWLIDG